MSTRCRSVKRGRKDSFQAERRRGLGSLIAAEARSLLERPGRSLVPQLAPRKRAHEPNVSPSRSAESAP
jgi:hypothetical protein